MDLHGNLIYPRMPDGVFAVGESKKGRRIPREERMKGYNEVEAIHCDYFLNAYGPGVVPVCVELHDGSQDMMYFDHPEQAVYIFGPEDGHVPKAIRQHCHHIVRIPSRHCLNLSSAVYVTLYDRHVKRVAAGLESPLALTEDRGFIEPDSMSGLLA